MRIALHDPQAPRSEIYRGTLASASHCCHVFTRVNAFLACIQRDTFDLIVIAGEAHDATLLDTLKTVRQRVQAPPTLVLLAGAGDADLIGMLDAGADDCIAEPVSEPLMLARAHALLRRSRTTRPVDRVMTQFDDYCFDPARCTVTLRGLPLILTPKELALALLLFRNIGRDLSRQYLIDGVWTRDAGPASRSLDTHISRIRNKLSLTADQGYQLSAIYSYGYRLDRFDESDAAGGIPHGTAAAPQPGGTANADAGSDADVDVNLDAESSTAVPADAGIIGKLIHS
jgi:DNA-binding response OmpR family regulator